MNLLVLFPAVVFGLTFLVIVGGATLRRFGFSPPLMMAEHCRNFKMVYLTLPIWMAFAFSFWFRKTGVAPLLKWAAPLLVVFALLVINFPGHKLARYAAWQTGWLPQASTKKLEAELREDAADLEVALWARNQTPPQSLFYFDSYEFRYYSRRSLVFCWWDRPCVAFHPTRELEEWSQRNDRIPLLKKTGDTSGMLALAREYKADYLVVLNTWKPLKQKPVWSNGKYSVFHVQNEANPSTPSVFVQ